MISLAICSTPQRMMTLSSIYRWIEGTFPFYRTPEAKAWKVCVVGMSSGCVELGWWLCCIPCGNVCYDYVTKGMQGSPQEKKFE